MVSAYLAYRSNKGEQSIQWHDRAINEIERLDNLVAKERSERLKVTEELAKERAENKNLLRRLEEYERKK